MESLPASVRKMLEENWVAAGYTAPNNAVYPWQWLWDSCFHSLIWAELGEPERALSELASLFGPQAPDGFVPHMNYVLDPPAAQTLWDRDGASSITQPPMYGHTVAELLRSGTAVPVQVQQQAADGLRHLLNVRQRDSASGLVTLVHPWESGCDDSARWEDAMTGGYDRPRWGEQKKGLVHSIVRNEHGSPVVNAEFAPASIGFNALIAWNVMELESVGAAGPELVGQAKQLVAALAARWDDSLITWVDAGTFAKGSGRARTTDALLGLLVDRTPTRVAEVTQQLLDPLAYGGECGPAGAHRDEPSYLPLTYWRGPAWPQLSYLLWRAVDAAGDTDTAGTLAANLRRGAAQSELAEYWHPDTGEGGGACPQSWAGLALLVP